MLYFLRIEEGDKLNVIVIKDEHKCYWFADYFWKLFVETRMATLASDATEQTKQNYATLWNGLAILLGLGREMGVDVSDDYETLLAQLTAFNALCRMTFAVQVEAKQIAQGKAPHCTWGIHVYRDTFFESTELNIASFTRPGK